MNSNHTPDELFDRYIKGKLSAEEIAAFRERMKLDTEFRKKAEEHIALAAELKFYGDRKQLKQMLEATHKEIDPPNPSQVISKSIPLSPWKRYWPMAAVAASVALISIVGTLLMTHSLETKQTAYYKELRRDVEQIQQSQKIMMSNLTETQEKEKDNIFKGNYAGTGFLVSANGFIATSYHVVKAADSVYIENEKFGRLKTAIVYSDPGNDISVLKITSQELLPLQSLPYTLAKSEANMGEDVFTLGYPREDVVFGEGSVSALTGYKQNPNAYQVSVPVNPGNSGGPLLNNKGDLIGIISGIQTEMLGTAFAIKSTVLLEAVRNAGLDTLSSPLVLPKQNTIKNSSRVQQVKRWRDYVFIVRVYKN